MYPNNENEKNATPENSVNEPLRYGPEYGNNSYESPVGNEPIYKEQNTGEQTYSKPAYSEPTANEPFYSKQVYHEISGNGHTYIESADAPWKMYSPGISVNQPYPRARNHDVMRNGMPRERKRWLGSFIRAACLVIVCSVFSAAAAYTIMDYRFERGDFAVTNQVVLGGSPSEIRHDGNLTSTVGKLTSEISAQDIYDMARKQVVGIVTEAPGLFGAAESPGGVSPVSGSGFIISTEGYILTNYHVIELAHANNLAISVVLNDGSSYEAEVVGFEQSNDVAVIKINASGLTPALIGNSDNIRVGQTIYAVGNPFGDLVYTMTDGIVSALDRVVSVEGKSIGTFQFSAAVNRGNSGGPIYNTEGEVLGIVTAKVVRGNVEGIGFAIPINDAIEIATELIEHGYISGRPLMGITGQTVTPGNAEYYDWVVGVYIRSVSPDSAADNAGIAIGDIITKLDNEEINTMDALKEALRNHRAGGAATITIWREGEYIDLTITFDEDMYAGQPQGRPHTEPDSPDPFENRP